MLEFFIPGNVPSSKNSQVWTGKFLVKSKAVQKYIKKSKIYWIKFAKQFQKQVEGFSIPLHVEFEFIRDSLRDFDYINAAQLVQDLMVTYKWIIDDKADLLLPSFHPYSYDKDNSGVWIRIR